MLSFCGYNFVEDMDALNFFLSLESNVTNSQLENGIYDYLDISKDVKTSYNIEEPSWGYDTILDCDFNGNIAGGNVSYTLEQLSSIQIKRRLYDPSNLGNWTVLCDIEVVNEGSIGFTMTDNLMPNGYTIEYAIVPIINGAEGLYITDNVESKFNGVYICDLDTMFKLYANVEYGDIINNQSIGVVETIGSQYPTIIRNNKIDYKKGSVKGKLLGANFETTRKINRNDVVTQINNYEKFLKNGKAKIIKDWNGNVWLITVVGAPTTTYDSNYGMGIASTNFEWVEQGKYSNQEDLYINGLSDTPS
jgi:hypothetical protein